MAGEPGEIKGATEGLSRLREFRITTTGPADLRKVTFPTDEDPGGMSYVLTGEALINPNRRDEMGRRKPSEAWICCNGQYDASNLESRTLLVEQFVYFPGSPAALAIPPRLSSSPEFLKLDDEKRAADNLLETVAKTKGDFVTVAKGDPNTEKLLQALRRRQKVYMMYCTDRPGDLARYLSKLEQ